MAVFWFGPALREMMSGTTLRLGVDELKLVLFKNTAVPNRDMEFVSELVAHECDATNYAGGYGNAGRLVVPSKTFSWVDSENDAVFDFGNLVWSSLGGGVNNDLTGAAVIKETGGSDATSRLIIWGGFAQRTTTGADFPLQPSSNGAGRIYAGPDS